VHATESDLVPLLRGVIHAWTAWVAGAAAIVLVLLAPTAQARVAAAVYGAGLCAMFAASGLYHRWRWDQRWRPLLRRLDHSAIFVFIAASATPVALLVLDGTLRVVVLATAWGAATAGVVMSVAWITAPRLLTTAMYVATGWAATVGLPQLAERVSVTPLVLLAAGGVLYTAGAVVYQTKRPDPWPRTFGFHEVFHVLVVLAAIVHYVAMAGWIVPS
jgi:hemolysin III